MENINQFADFIWAIKELIRDEYAEKDYEEVILPFTLLRRLDCVLEANQEAVDKAFEKHKNLPPDTRDKLLKNASKNQFYNTSGFTLSKLVKSPADIGENFSAYLKGFSTNIKDILYNFSGGEEKGLSPIYETLLRKELLYIVTLEFTKIDLHTNVVDNHTMGTIFEILIRKAKETTNEKAGQYYTPREIVQLMVNLVFAGEEERLNEKGAGIMIYDPCCGTGGMLTEAKEHLLNTVNENLDVFLFGQEINEQTYAIAKSDVLMKGENADNIKHGNTITKDKLVGKQFNYMLTNPPFGDDWKNMREYVEEEAELGTSGRFQAGLPDVSDGSLLFLQHMIDKMNPKGSKIGIVFNGSPLFNGDAGGGWSNIRGWILEEDLLDTIVALPKDLFFGTGIGTYIWVLNNHKPEERKNKVQLINGVHHNFTEKLRRSIGKKQYKISDQGIEDITKMYMQFDEAEIDVKQDDGNTKPTQVVKIFDYEDFKYRKVTVERPLRLAYKITDESLQRLKEDKKFMELATSKKKDPAKAKEDIEKGEKKQKQILAALEPLKEKGKINSDHQFFVAIDKCLPFKLNKGQIKMLRDVLGEKNEEAQEVFDNPLEENDQTGAVHTWEVKPLYDSDLRDTENIPWKQDVDEYFATEVLPFAPDAWMDREKDKIGYEIPFTKYFYEYKPLRDLDKIMADINALEEETEDLLEEIKED
ncbi:MAG: SAM-dependent DNA methyltransferase [Clostridia bacterium]|nr:SAM-dependent DNA methyltransferase [Clostridia bacterium]